jgi:uncharacterized protein involved in outer membrane biogenesis
VLGPRNPAVLTPYSQDALNRSADGPQITISGGRLGIDRETRQLDLWIEGVRISQSDGEPLAAFPDISAAFSLRSLLSGRVAPTRLMIQRPVLRLIRDETGAIRFRFGDQEGDASSFGPEIIEQLAGPPKPAAALGSLRWIIIRDATLVLDDRQTGRRWQADRVDAVIDRNPEGFAGDLSLALPTATPKPEFHASYRYSSGERMLDFALEIGAVEPAALASLAPELAPLAVANFPVSGTLATRLNVAAATTEGLRADLRFGKGSIKSELLPEGALALQEGTLRAVYAPETGELRLAKLDLDLGGGSALSVRALSTGSLQR